jgi:hypothetical protein
MSRRHAQLSFFAIPLAVVAIAAGCGGSGSASPQVANLGSSKTGKSSTSSGSGGSAPATSSSARGQSLVMAGENAHNAAKFSACMRKHGVANFPDPTSTGAIQIGPNSGINPGSSTFQAAQQTCRKLLPHGGQPSPAQLAAAKQHALAFSACMRRHGLHDFPDPNFSGGGITLKLRGSPGGDLNPNSPTFQAAQKACQGDLPGKLGKVTDAGTK